MLVVIVVSVDRFVEGRILNAVHFVPVVGVHSTSSSLAVRCVSAGRLFILSGGLPLLTVPIIQHLLNVVKHFVNGSLNIFYYSLDIIKRSLYYKGVAERK